MLTFEDVELRQGDFDLKADMAIDAAKVTEEPVEKKSGEEDGEFAIYHSVLASKDDDAIPEAKYEDNTPAGEEKKEKDSEKD